MNYIVSKKNILQKSIDKRQIIKMITEAQEEKL